MDPSAYMGGGDPLLITSVALWTIVEVAGLIFAIVLMFGSPRSRRVAAMVAIALALALVSRWAWVPYFRWAVSSSAGWPDSERGIGDALRWGSFAFDKLSLISKVLLVIAAFMGARAMARPVAPAVAPPPIPPTGSPGVAGPPMAPLSKGARIGGIVAGGVISLLLSALGLILAQDRTTAPAALVVAAFSLVPLIVVMVLIATTLHAAWKSIAPPPVGRGIPGYARTTPGKAVGFLFIPFFNLYWVFQAVPGFASDANRTLGALGLHHPRVSRGLGIAWCVGGILGLIPFVGVVVGLAGLVIVPLFLAGAIDAANAIRTLPQGVPGEATPPPLPEGGAATA